MSDTMAATAPSKIQLTVDRAELAAALAAVRFAVGTDPELPMLAGILFALEGDALRLVATDSYRIAFAGAAVLSRIGAGNIAKTTRAIRDHPGRALPLLGITNNPDL